MSDLRAKIHNERMRSFSGTLSTLASAVMILGVLRPELERAQGNPVVTLTADANIWFVIGAIFAYTAAYALLGTLRDEG